MTEPVPLAPVRRCAVATFMLKRFKRYLPARHRLIAEKTDESFGHIDVLIEGPDFSDAPLNDPPAVFPIFNMIQPDGVKVVVTGQWDAHSSKTWIVGEWATYEDYYKEMHAP